MPKMGIEQYPKWIHSDNQYWHMKSNWVTFYLRIFPSNSVSFLPVFGLFFSAKATE